MKLVNIMKQMLIPAETIGDIKNVSVDENFIGMMDRINIVGISHGGRKFELTLEITNEKEEEKDA